MRLTPRPLRADETPEPGDVFFQRGSQLMSVLIRLATGSDINHAGIIVANFGNGSYLVAEANNPGFEIAHKHHFTGYVVRVSEHDVERLVLATLARRLARKGLRYDYLAIVRFAAIVLRRSRPGTLPGRLLLGLPAFVVRLIGRVLLRLLPDESPDRVICSGAVRKLLRTAFTEEGWGRSLPPRDDETSPADLLAALYGRGRW